MEQPNYSELINEDKKDKRFFKYIIFMLICFVIGVGIGITFTKKYLEDKDEPVIDEEVLEKGPLDITENKEYTTLINNLYGIVKGNTMFYNSTGTNINTLSNNLKLNYVYNYVINNKLYTDTSINSLWWNSPTCEYDFLTTVVTNEDGSSYMTGACDLKQISKSAIVDNYFKIFNNKVIDVSAEFYPSNTTKCIVSEENYLCGNINSVDGITGELTPKFEIQKVTKDEDETIVIYEKGYLVDTRSSVVKPDDGHDNYYLHSADSTSYYYELKSADNLTFMHTFQKDKTGNYYYIKTELKK